MKTIIVNILFALIFTFSYSQNNEGIYPNFIGKTLSNINNDLDWKILVKAEGDLNNDNLIDYVLVLESKDSILTKRCLDCRSFKQKPRILLVLLYKNYNPIVKIQNNKFIARSYEGGMTTYIEPELSIEKGLLTIYYQYTRSNQSYSFKFNGQHFVIVNAKSSGVHAASGRFSSDVYDFFKNEINYTTGHISNDIDKTQIIKINVKPKLLSEFGEMYEWEVVENKYL